MSHRWTLFRMPFELLYDVGPRWAVLYADELRDHILVHYFVMFSHMVSFLNDHDDFSAFTIDMGINYSNLH